MVNGIEMAARTSRSRRSTSGRSRSRPEPPLHFTTLLTGQPKLMSRMSKPRSWQTRAASAITAGSAPNSCAEIGMLVGLEGQVAAASCVGLRAPSEALTPCELVNSVMISPQPPRLRMKRRKTVSVTPAMGASTVAGAIRDRSDRKLGGERMHDPRLLQFYRYWPRRNETAVAAVIEV